MSTFASETKKRYFQCCVLKMKIKVNHVTISLYNVKSNNTVESFTCRVRSICRHMACFHRTQCHGSHGFPRTLHSFPSHRHLDAYHATAGPAWERFHPSTPIAPPLQCLSFPRTLFHRPLEWYLGNNARRSLQQKLIQLLH